MTTIYIHKLLGNVGFFLCCYMPHGLIIDVSKEKFYAIQIERTTHSKKDPQHYQALDFTLST